MDEKILIYEKSVPGRTGYTLPDTEKPADKILSAIPEGMRRTSDAALPEVAEPEVMRHFVAMSVKNHHIDKGFYPLGSCTMKYNPKQNDAAASFKGFREQHPLAPCGASNANLQLMWELSQYLGEVSGFDAMSLQPVAGAHGEFCGLLIMRAYHVANNDTKRQKIIIPDSAHGTNPASVTSVGYTTVQIESGPDGIITPEAVEAVMDDEVAGMMLTNPNTLGLFESNIEEISRIVHEGGGLMYMDGANLNANMGVFRPGKTGFDIMHFNLHKTFSTPHGGGGPGAGAVGVVAKLEPFLPFPVLEKNGDDKLFFNYDRPQSIGRLSTFYGNFGNMVRAYTYIKTLGGQGLRQVSENAVINANYLKELLREDYDLPHERHCMHEFVISGNRQKKLGVKTSDISKRLLDFGVHAPTNYFPLIVPEAMMIEPTETESRETLEEFAVIMKQIAREAEIEPDTVREAPHNTPVRRMDEISAARQLDIAYLD
ncbi:aminotransferase class V-fold PLP-dependent enzyme [candidate division GN15 bacterium]|nr:aminotransferase class V-fold PLP-dependent enzyme [candidate division GN15 bacterium]